MSNRSLHCSGCRQPVFMWIALIVLFSLPAMSFSADWSPDLRLTYDPAASVLSYWGGGKCLATGADGRVHVVWYDNRQGEYGIFYKCLVGSIWSAAEPVADHPGLDPCIAVGPPPTVSVVWYWFGYNAFCVRHTGSDWELVKDLSDCSDENAVYPAVTVDAAGNTYVVWSHGWPPNRILGRVFDGVAWGPCETIVETSGYAQSPTIVAGDSSEIHLCWQDDRDGNMEIYYRMFDGHEWGEPERLTQGPGASEYPCLAYGGGNLHLVWHETLEDNSEVHHMAYSGEWTRPVCISPDEGLSSGPLKVAVDSRGCAHVVWVDTRYTEGEIYYRHSDSTGTVWSPETRLTIDPAISTNPSVAVDVNGRVHVVWEDERDLNREIYYKTAKP